jgi:S-adenosylmethionine:tRNA ribosyltransferase-isomerase
MIPASLPIQRPATARMLVLDENGDISHRQRTELPSLLCAGDLVIANDAATLPASLTGTHAATGQPIEVRLAGRDSLLLDRVRRFVAVAFGAGDFHTPTERRLPPPAFDTGDMLALGPLRAMVVRTIAHPRLVEIEFLHPASEIWEGIARHGRPIQYAHVPSALAIWDTWTPLAHVPVAFEAPSAGFVIDWTMVERLRRRGATLMTLTHAAGISSTGDADLDRLLPFDEPYFIPAATARAIAAARTERRRVIAIGTTVVRALEHATAADGAVRAGEGTATNRIGAASEILVVDALLSGMHEPGTSHYELLRAFHDDEALGRMASEAEARGYRAHEFGDSVFLINSSQPSGSCGKTMDTTQLSRIG